MKKFDSFLNYFLTIGLGIIMFICLLKIVAPEIFTTKNCPCEQNNKKDTTQNREKK